MTQTMTSPAIINHSMQKSVHYLNILAVLSVKADTAV